MNKNFKKLTNIEKTKIKGGGSFLVVWGMGLLTFSIIRSMFSEKSSLALNGVGRISWEDKKENSKKEISKEGTIDLGLKNYFE